MLSRQPRPQPCGDHRERIIRARQTAEALSHRNRRSAHRRFPEFAPAIDHQPARKPRVLGIIASVAPAPQQTVEAPVSPEAPATRKIPRPEFARIRAWVKYGMRTAQVAAAVYGAAVDDIQRIIRQT